MGNMEQGPARRRGRVVIDRIVVDPDGGYRGVMKFDPNAVEIVCIEPIDDDFEPVRERILGEGSGGHFDRVKDRLPRVEIDSDKTPAG